MLIRRTRGYRKIQLYEAEAKTDWMIVFPDILAPCWKQGVIPKCARVWHFVDSAVTQRLMRQVSTVLDREWLIGYSPPCDI